MSVQQLDLLTAVAPYSEPATVNGKQHQRVLEALREFTFGATGEEIATFLHFRATHIATTRLGELAVWEPVPLVAKTGTKRATASGRRASVFILTDAGKAWVAAR